MPSSIEGRKAFAFPHKVNGEQEVAMGQASKKKGSQNYIGHLVPNATYRAAKNAGIIPVLDMGYRNLHSCKWFGLLQEGDTGHFVPLQYRGWIHNLLILSRAARKTIVPHPSGGGSLPCW